MIVVNVLEAKTSLSRLIAQVEAGGEVVIARNNKPVVRLVAMATGKAEPAPAWQPPPMARTLPRTPGRQGGTPKPRRVPGRLKGLIEWDDRFNDRLPDDELRLGNGEGDFSRVW